MPVDWIAFETLQIDLILSSTFFVAMTRSPLSIIHGGADQYKRFAFNTFKICLLSFLGHSGAPPWYSGRQLAAINQPNFEC